MLRLRNRWISAARIIEYPQANLFDRSICSLVWATLASFWKLSRSVYIRQTINFDEINVSNCHTYYPVNTCIRIALISSLIDGFSKTNCQPWVHPKGLEDTPLIRLCNGSATALPQLYYRPYIVAHTIVRTNGSTSSLRTALHHLYKRLYERLHERLCNGPATALQMALQMALQRLYERLYERLCMALQRLYEWLCNGSMDSLLVQQSQPS